MDRAGFAAVVAPLGRPLVSAQRSIAVCRSLAPVSDAGTTEPTSLVVPEIVPPPSGPTPSPRGRFRAHHQWPSGLLQPAELLRSMLATVWELGREGTSTRPQDRRRSPCRDGRGLPVFRPTARCARSPCSLGADQAGDPVYLLAKDLAGHRCRRLDGVTGAGPGIMAAGSEGAVVTMPSGEHPPPRRAGCEPVHRPGPEAGRDALLLHEEAHVVEGEPRLRGAARGLRDPGRVLRAVNPPPDRQGRAGAGRARRDAWRTYWHGWKRFLEEQAIAPGWVSPDDVALFRVANSVEERLTRSSASTPTTSRAAGWRPPGAARPHHAVEGRAGGPQPPVRRHHRLRLDPTRRTPATGALQQRRLGPGPGALRFDRYHFGRLRMLIDALNECTG